MAKRTAATSPAVIEVPAENPEALAVRESGGPVLQFMSGDLTAFFTTARAIESGAATRLAKAQAMRVPASATEDAAVQTFVLETNAALKTATGHWSVTQAVHALHKALTTRRSRATDALEAAAKLATGLHNRYADAERRRAAEEEEARRCLAEQEARRKQDEEAARLEQVALDLEAESADLSDRERSFVERVAYGERPEDAARRAGYKNPIQMGARLMTLQKIRDAVQGRIDSETARRQAQAVKSAPVDVSAMDVDVAPNIVKVGTERTTYSGEVLDQAAAVEAFRSGQYGIPGDLFMVNPVKLNEYARSMRENINRWPGVRLKKATGLS